jgi:type IV pilus assembly protein PilN
MKLTINLATRRYVNLRQLNGLLLCGFVLLGSLALFKAVEVGRNAAELSRIRNLIQGTGTRDGGVRISEAQLKSQEARIQFANQAIDKKSVDWVTLLDRLEDVVPAGVALSKIAPDAKQELSKIAPDAKQAVELAGVAHSFTNLRALLENMEHSKNFSEVYLLAQSEAKVGMTQEGITFAITCKVLR